MAIQAFETQGLTGGKGKEMKNCRLLQSLLIAAIVIGMPLFCARANAQDPQQQNQATALMRGYRTGYSDGYPAGVKDSTSGATRDFRANAEYQQGDRGYLSTYGTLEEYRGGYQQGFEAGYNDGYDRKSFNSAIPSDLKQQPQSDNSNQPTLKPADPNANSSGALISIPRDTVMRVELLSNLSTDASQKGDRFQVRVIEPKEYEAATIDGHIALVKRPGRAKGTAELQLSFDEIRLADGRSARLNAQVIEVLAMSGNTGVGKVDTEGGVQGRDSTKDDVKKVGVGAGVGAVIGAIFGGGSGAAIGATIGAGIGTAGVLRERGKDIYLYQGQQLRIRTAGNTEAQ